MVANTFLEWTSTYATRDAKTFIQKHLTDEHITDYILKLVYTIWL